MNNEDKILSVLETLVLKVEKLEAGQSKLEAGQVRLEAEQAKMAEDITIIRHAVAVIEHDHGKQLQALVDGQVVYDEELSDIRLRLLRLEHVL